MLDVFLQSSGEPSQGPTADEEDEEADGAILDFSDSGQKRHAFAVVELDSGQTVVVPVEKLRTVPPS